MLFWAVELTTSISFIISAMVLLVATISLFWSSINLVCIVASYYHFSASVFNFPLYAKSYTFFESNAPNLQVHELDCASCGRTQCGTHFFENGGLDRGSLLEKWLRGKCCCYILNFAIRYPHYKRLPLFPEPFILVFCVRPRKGKGTPSKSL